VAVGATPESLDVSPDGATVAVANARSGDVSLIDRERLVERARVPLPGSPVRVRYHPDGRLLAVSLANVGQVALLDRDGAVKALVPVGNRPDGLAFSPNGRLLYVALTGDNRVAVVDVAARRVVRALPAGDGPSGLLLVP
jgi:YVTN family beta-propeller protein